MTQPEPTTDAVDIAMMNRTVLKKALIEVRLLFAACAAVLFAFCWLRVWIVSRL